ncbi:unnamed protein product [Aureobasidium mustum]|uniref:Uncharacterized protein n=1 Tax=Aureobasidium mustum TaxID=2773714 RepID=A0A9N8JLA4_9PEZI|nr:unnamed protein product [Aureobasidium mustum]
MQEDISESIRDRLSHLTLHDLLVCVVRAPKPDWLPDNNKIEYLAYVKLASHEFKLLIAGEPADDRSSALDMLLWSIKARIALKFYVPERFTTSLFWYATSISYSSPMTR